MLIAASALGLLAANTGASATYLAALAVHVGPLSLLHWINDGLMAVFFLLVGLEIKREVVDGQLSTWPRRALPGLAAFGGMAAPALIYAALNASSPQTLRGWAIPAATDIAFTLAVLALLGRRVPVSLKIFVTALAIIDDLGAVLIIAVFYTAQLHAAWLAAAGGVLALLALMNRLKVDRLWPYLIAGLALWACALQSGVHATLAGVALACAIPLTPSPGRPDDAASLLHRLEHGLAPWVAFLIVPLFGLANAGVPLAGVRIEHLTGPVTLGVAVGLFVGKQLGVFALTWLAVRLGLADWPEDASPLQVYGVAILCGVGFTMSLFIGLLAFPGEVVLQNQVKVGVLAGSLLSAITGAALLALAAPRPGTRPPAQT